MNARELTPTLRRFLMAIAEGRWGRESGNRIAAVDRLAKLGLARWIFTPYTLGAYAGTSSPALTPNGERVVAALKKSSLQLDAEIAEVLGKETP